VQAPGLYLRQNKNPASTISEMLEHSHHGARIHRQNHSDLHSREVVPLNVEV